MADRCQCRHLQSNGGSLSTKQPEALRLADELTTPHMEVHREAAAELRRLHDENKLLHERHSFNNREFVRLHSVNSELLDALKLAQLIVNPAHAYGIAIEAAIAKAQE